MRFTRPVYLERFKARAITSEAEKLGLLSDNVDASLDKISSKIDLFKV